MPGPLIYQCSIAPEWIDYNGHLRDAYYGLILSFAVDAWMDMLGMDAGYREKTKATLYTLEAHIHYLREVKQADALSVYARIIAADHKRIHAGFELRCDRIEGPAATAEQMLLHVQQGATPKSLPFPADIQAAIAAFQQASEPTPNTNPGSRKIELKAR
jgi:acyl-CoA thioester hydrolase